MEKYQPITNKSSLGSLPYLIDVAKEHMAMDSLIDARSADIVAYECLRTIEHVVCVVLAQMFLDKEWVQFYYDNCSYLDWCVNNFPENEKFKLYREAASNAYTNASRIFYNNNKRVD